MPELQDILNTQDLVNINVVSVNNVPVDDYALKNKAITDVYPFEAIGYNSFFSDGDPLTQGWRNLITDAAPAVVQDTLLGGQVLHMLDNDPAGYTSMIYNISAAQWQDIWDFGATINIRLRIEGDTPEGEGAFFYIGVAEADNPGYTFQGSTLSRIAWRVRIDRVANIQKLALLDIDGHNTGEQQFDLGVVDVDVIDINLVFTPGQSEVTITDNAGFRIGSHDIWTFQHTSGNFDGNMTFSSGGNPSLVGSSYMIQSVTGLVANGSSIINVTSQDMSDEREYAIPSFANDFTFNLPTTPSVNNGLIKIKSQSDGKIIIQQTSGDTLTLVNTRPSITYQGARGTNLDISIEQYQPGFAEGQNYFATFTQGDLFDADAKQRTVVNTHKILSYNSQWGDGTHQAQGWANAGQANVIVDQEYGVNVLEVKDINATINTSVNIEVTSADWKNIHDFGASMDIAFRMPATAPDLEACRFVVGFDAASNHYDDYGWLTRGAWQVEVRRNGANAEFRCPDASDTAWKDLGVIETFKHLRCQMFDSVSTMNVLSYDWAPGTVSVKANLQDLLTPYGDNLLIMGSTGDVANTGQIMNVFTFTLTIAEESRTIYVTEQDLIDEVKFTLPDGAANYIFYLPEGAQANYSKFSIQSKAIGSINIRRPVGDTEVLIDNQSRHNFAVEQLRGITIYIEQYTTHASAGKTYSAHAQESV